MSNESTGKGVPPKRASCFEEGYPAQLKAVEEAAVSARRKAAGQPAGLPGETVGLAFSGGGIRSATFCLGVLQALAKQKLIGKIDYLSTVSGGSYIGGFFGAIFMRPWAAVSGQTVGKVEETLENSFSKPVSWLRENGRYLSPNGAGDALLDGATYIRSWVGLQFLLSVFLLMIFSGFTLLRQIAWNRVSFWQTFEESLAVHARESIWWSPLLFAPALLLLVFVIPLIWSYWLTQRDSRDFDSKMPMLVTLAILGASAGSAAYWHQNKWSIDDSLAAALALLAFLALSFWWLAAMQSKSKEPGTQLRSTRNRLSLWLATAVGATALLLLFTLIDSLGQTLYALYHFKAHPLAMLAGATGLAAFMAVAQKLLVHLAPQPNQKASRPKLSVALISTVAALLITFVILTFWSAVTHAVLWNGETPSGDPAARIFARAWPAQSAVKLDEQRRILVVEPVTPAAIVVKTSVPQYTAIASVFTLALLLSITLGRSMKFLNLSSQQAIYNARLSRAYLGASNEKRWSGEGQRISEVMDGDDVGGSNLAIAMPYRPDQMGGPLHLINVTLNETVDGKSQVEQQDRKGLPMAVGPCGMSAGLRSHALWEDGGDDRRYVKIEPVPNDAGFHHFSEDGEMTRQVERLDLGTWVAISGAAFSTGLGAKTNLGMSLLAGMINVRLGYWWDSLVAPHRRANRVVPPWPQRLLATITSIFPAQMHLIDEFLARFHGAARRRWYLSDGGHFENTGAYELLRRRVPFIIICDDGQDEDYAFEDAANLVRKARLDFDAEIEFLGEEDLGKLLLPGPLRQGIGTLQQLHRSKKAPGAGPADCEGRFANARYSSTHAALAWVYYEGNKVAGSLILLIKPSLTGDEPLDVLEYHSAQPAFPQETTLDQFFDEAQWESYRRLGEHIASELFAPAQPGATWSPAMMRKP